MADDQVKPTGEKLNLEAEVEAMHPALDELFAKPLTARHLADWKSRTLIPQNNFLSYMIVGSILWKRSIGTPLASPLAEAFDIRVIEHGGRMVPDNSLAGFHFEDKHLTVNKWDGASDPDFYSVNFSTFAADNYLSPGFDVAVVLEHAVWTSDRPYVFTRRIVDPPQRTFNKRGFTQIEPFHVEQRIFIDVHL